MKGQYHIVRCNISGEAAEKFDIDHSWELLTRT